MSYSTAGYTIDAKYDPMEDAILLWVFPVGQKHGGPPPQVVRTWGDVKATADHYGVKPRDVRWESQGSLDRAKSALRE